VAVIGAELVACELAEFLTAQGKHVTIMRRGSEVAAKVGPALRLYLVPRLQRAGVQMFTSVNYIRATDKGLEIITADGVRQLVAADSIVIAAGAVPEQMLFQQLKNKVADIYQAGDCVAPRGIMEAVSEGYRAGMEI
jgi:2,4-dienoyl-CoA reductase (NADPH2)